MIAIYLRVSNSKLEDYLKSSGTLKEDINDYNLNAGGIEDFNVIDIDKAWAGLFYLLTGELPGPPGNDTNPLQWILNAPQYIDSKQDLGYGQALYTTIEQTKTVSSALNNISEDGLKKKWDVELMNELSIYPFEDGDWSEEGFDYLMQAFRQLKGFYNKAVIENKVIILLFG